MKYAIIKNGEVIEYCRDSSVFVGKVWQDFKTQLASIQVIPPFTYETLKILPVIESQKPSYDEATQTLSRDKEVISEDSVIIEFVVRDLTLEEIQLKKILQAESKRKKAEVEAIISFKGKTIKADDKTMTILSNYIFLGKTGIVWKCENNEWITLSNQEMRDILELITNKKKELFEKEFDETI